MKLVDMTIKNYLDVLGSDAPAPGGGSVSALSAAQGAALTAMVCDLTIPKEDRNMLSTENCVKK